MHAKAEAQPDLFAKKPPTFGGKRQQFDGPAYVAEFDHKRLTGQIQRVYALMIDGRWRTLDEIARETGDPHASVSAQLRHLRKPRFGSHTIDKRARGERSHGLWEYKLTLTQT